MHSPAAALYRAIYQLALSRPKVAELTVEDPAEAFEDLRDRCDLRMLLSHQKFMEEGLGRTPNAVVPEGEDNAVVVKKGKLGPPAERGWVEKWRVDLKIAKVSFGGCA